MKELLQKKLSLMRFLLFLFSTLFIVESSQLNAQQSDLFYSQEEASDYVLKLEKGGISEIIKFYIHTGRQNEYQNVSYLYFKDDILLYQKFDFNPVIDKKARLINYKIKDAKSIKYVRSFIENFSDLGQNRCVHFDIMQIRNIRPNTYKYDVGFAKDEWRIFLFRKSDGQYAQYSTSKTRLFYSRCQKLSENIRARKKFKQFLEVLEENKIAISDER